MGLPFSTSSDNSSSFWGDLEGGMEGDMKAEMEGDMEGDIEPPPCNQKPHVNDTQHYCLQHF